MLRLGVIEWVGFTPPVRPITEHAEDTTSKDVEKIAVKDHRSTPTAPVTDNHAHVQVRCRSTSTQTDPKMFGQPTEQSTEKPPTATEQPAELHHKGTQIRDTLTPPAKTRTPGVRRKDECIVGLARLRQVTHKGFHWTALMITVLLRFVYHAVVNLNWSWRAS